jgi:hypothetical protein
MSLQPVKTAASKIRAVVIKAFEYFTGGFSVSLTNFAGTTLPEGSLVRVDEDARTTQLVKTGQIIGRSPSTEKHYFKDDGDYPLLFVVGDKVAVAGGATASTIRTITVKDGSGWVVTVATAINRGTSTSNAVVYKTTSHGIGAPTLAPPVIANAIVAEDATIGESLTALRRGTVYKNRVQPHITAHLADLPATIQLSTSK